MVFDNNNSLTDDSTPQTIGPNLQDQNDAQRVIQTKMAGESAKPKIVRPIVPLAGPIRPVADNLPQPLPTAAVEEVDLGQQPSVPSPTSQTQPLAEKPVAETPDAQTQATADFQKPEPVLPESSPEAELKSITTAEVSQVQTSPLQTPKMADTTSILEPLVEAEEKSQQGDSGKVTSPQEEVDKQIEEIQKTTPMIDETLPLKSETSVLFDKPATSTAQTQNHPPSQVDEEEPLARTAIPGDQFEPAKKEPPFLSKDSAPLSAVQPKNEEAVSQAVATGSQGAGSAASPQVRTMAVSDHDFINKLDLDPQAQNLVKEVEVKGDPSVLGSQEKAADQDFAEKLRQQGLPEEKIVEALKEKHEEAASSTSGTPDAATEPTVES